MHIQQIKLGPKGQPGNQADFQQGMAAMVGQISQATAEFIRRYPRDPRRFEAQLLQIETGNAVNKIEGHPDDAGMATQLRELASEPAAPANIRGGACYELLGLSVSAYVRRDPGVTAAFLVNQLHQFITEFPAYPHLDLLTYKVADTLGLADPQESDALLQELAASGQGPVAVQARKDLAAHEKLKSPLDLHFTAADGTPVDLSQMRGKVVLVHFWATQSDPCRADLPNVIAAYQKLHDQGFEVIGISLDQNRNQLLSFTAQNNMPWPEYFDGKGWQNDVTTAFSVEQIPTMWLVNKKGYVVTTNGRDDLEGQVEKLLAEQ
jgi:peroxiredoxin